MAIDIDGYAVLGAIARDRQAFPEIQSDVSKTARALVVKQLKAKTLTLAQLEAMAAAIGHETIDLILDMMADTEIKSLFGKIDKYSPDVKAGTAHAQRKSVSDLAKGLATPTTKAVVAKPAKAPRQTKPSVERAINSRSMRAKKL
jgi:hypothetical protein